MLLHRQAIDKDLKDRNKTVLPPGLYVSVSVLRRQSRNVASCFLQRHDNADRMACILEILDKYVLRFQTKFDILALLRQRPSRTGVEAFH